MPRARLPEWTALLFAAASLLPGCLALTRSSGGGQTELDASLEERGDRPLDPTDIAVPRGYRARLVASGLTFPTAVTFDGEGTPFLVESGYCYGEVFTVPRLLRVERDGRLTEVHRGDTERAPWNGVDFHEGSFFIAEGGHLAGGRITRLDPDGSTHVLADDLPSLGDHHTNSPRVAADGYVYFGQGVATNSAVVGTDNHAFGWLERNPGFHDVPGADVRLAGEDFTTRNPLTEDEDDEAVTGAFLPFGTPSEPGQMIRGRVPCTGAILRVPIGGGAIELVAWGLRNPFGLAWHPDGSLYVTDNSFDARGSRPVWGTGDVLWKIEAGRWYGWPDYFAGEPLWKGERFAVPGAGRRPARVLAEDPGPPPPEPAAVLAVHSSSNGFDVSFAPEFGYVGEAFIAQFGDMAPGVGKVWAPVGFRVVRVHPGTGVVEEFAANRGRIVGPASRVGGGGFERPIDARFSPDGTTLYVVDFGVMTVDDEGPEPVAGTGAIWAISREGAPEDAP